MRRIAIFVGLLPLALAGCGGGGSSSTDAPAATSAPPPATAAAGAQGGRFCELIRTYSDRLSGLSAASSDKARIRQFATDLGSAIREAVTVAPPERKADSVLVAGAANDYLAALKSAGYDLSKVPPSATQRFQAPDVAAASDRLSTYARDVCRTTR
jgi:hypothetical protein